MPAIARPKSRELSRALLCAAAVLVLCAACEDSAPHAREPKPGSKATSAQSAQSAHDRAAAAEPNDGLTALDGPELLQRMRASGDKGSLVSVWASWCKSCKKELPMLMGMASALRAERIGLMFISADDPKDRDKAATMWRELAPGQPGLIVRGALGPFKRALHPSWKGSLPSTFLFDDKAVSRYFWPGPVFDYEIEPIVGMFLSGQPLVGPTRVEGGPQE